MELDNHVDALVLAPMTVVQLAERLNKPLNAVILLLLKQGIVAPRNHVLPPEIVEKVARLYGVEVIVEKKDLLSEHPQQAVGEIVEGKIRAERLPVVVVVGHVDHGKTTLLDFIRKTRVAAKEKGGITQHLGAYKAHTERGDVIFLDTPGHEAFSIVRARGVKTADVAILVVAADSGVQPQTLEAVELLKQAEVPVVVAVNKIDRATPKQIEQVKVDLSKHGLIPDDWGGQTVYVQISALNGTGVDELLGMVLLQAQEGGLSTYLDVPVFGYVIESRFEKGRGPVAIVICRQGVLRVGDCFTCGGLRGRVSSLKETSGKIVKSVNPSNPVIVAGFTEMPHTGDVLSVCAKDKHKASDGVLAHRKAVDTTAFIAQEDAVRLIVKADSALSREVLIGALQKISQKSYAGFQIVNTGIGSITEGDVSLAADTRAMVVGLHVKIEPKAVYLSQKSQVQIKVFDIIYHLLEYLKDLGEKGRPVKKVTKKIGEAIVLKIFEIKKLGIVAGARMTDGHCLRTSTVKVYRAERLVGSGTISSLQRDRSAVKEVKKGFECAFMVNGFEAWEVDDRVECFEEVVAE
jgi:translation initiation factor IF-2